MKTTEENAKIYYILDLLKHIFEIGSDNIDFRFNEVIDRVEVKYHGEKKHINLKADKPQAAFHALVRGLGDIV